jgi:hypothetical protein
VSRGDGNTPLRSIRSRQNEAVQKLLVNRAPRNDWKLLNAIEDALQLLPSVNRLGVVHSRLRRSQPQLSGIGGDGKIKPERDDTRISVAGYPGVFLTWPP